MNQSILFGLFLSLLTASAFGQIPLTGSGPAGSGTAPAFEPRTFDGSTFLRITTGGINPSTDPASGTLTRSGGSVNGSTSTTGGANYEPSLWQTVTAGGGGCSGVRGQVQGAADGTIDWTTLSFSGTGHDGVALSAGSSCTSNPSAVVTRKCTKFVISYAFQKGSVINGEFMFGSTSGAVQQQLLTGIVIRTDLNNANASTGMRATDTANLSASTQTLIIAIDTTLAYNSGGLRIYLDSSDVTPAPPAIYNPVVDGTAAGLIDMSNSVTAAFAVAGNTSGATGVHGVLSYFYFAAGKRAIDAIAATATVPDISSSTVRSRFTASKVNITNGSGGTGTIPQIFLEGNQATWQAGINKGAGPNFTVTGTIN